MRRLALLLTVLLLLILPSCDPSDGFKGGRPITKEDLESVSASLFTTTEPEDEQTATPPTHETTATADTDAETAPDTDTDPVTSTDTEPAETDPADTVYWLTTGSVYHLDPNCSYIAGKENVNETSLQEAEASGRRLCKTCEKRRQGE